MVFIDGLTYDLIQLLTIIQDKRINLSVIGLVENALVLGPRIRP